ncbi:hypothetical protein OG579_08420 [Williamsia herbipolensis]|uniref:Polysaccharide biosynthesis protein n=1 Tax=Williamsia herbipolensis TaxID=1603258 RepID=A0AAU4K745_9NOCA|nr:hypothetical protein [Williamsia herbipolensis]
MISLAANAAVATVALWLIVARFGPDSYGLYSLLATLILAVSFADLGLGAVLINATTDFRSGAIDRSAFVAVHDSIRRVLWLIAAVIVMVAVGLCVSGQWPAILGGVVGGRSAQIAASLVVAVIGVSIPFGVGPRILQGDGRMSDVVKYSVFGPIVQLVIFLPLVFMLEGPQLLAVAPAVGAFAVAWWTDRRARAELDLQLLRAAPRAGGKRLGRGVLSSSLSYLVISVGLALAFQSQRVVLSHNSSAAELSQYAVVAQYLIPLYSIATVAGQAMWPEYRAADKLLTGRSLRRHIAVFALLGVAGAVVLVCTVTVIGRWLLGGAISLPVATLMAACVYLIVLFAHQPSAMVLTDFRGLAAQAVLVAVAGALTVAGTVWAAGPYGAAGAFAVAGLVVGVVQLVPTYLLACRHVARRQGAR